VFRARIKTAFSVTGRGTFISVEITDGEIEVGDEIVLPLVDGEKLVEVKAVGYIDYIRQRKTEVGLGVGEIEPDRVVVGAEVRAEPG
jgi:GTPase